MEYLDKLIETVEGGNKLHFDWTDCILALGKKAHPSQLCVEAYHGSLDAAKALHEALLPDHTRDVDATSLELGICVRIWSPDGPITGVGDKECEARSWLIATLKAHRHNLAKGETA